MAVSASAIDSGACLIRASGAQEADAVHSRSTPAITGRHALPQRRGRDLVRFDLRLRLVDEGKVGADLIGIATTLGPGSADPAGNVTNYAASLYSEIGALLAPDDSPPTK